MAQILLLSIINRTKVSLPNQWGLLLIQMSLTGTYIYLRIEISGIDTGVETFFGHHIRLVDVLLTTFSLPSVTFVRGNVLHH